MKCTLCGFKFSENDAIKCCKGCIMSKNCELIKCPNCYFELPRESVLIKERRLIWNCKK